MDSSHPIDDFLIFERMVFGDQLPIPEYDPYLIRYNEYRFPLEMFEFQSEDKILDVGCEMNIFILYLAYLGMSTLGVDINSRVWRPLKKRKKRVERITKRKLDLSFKVQDATQLNANLGPVDKVVAISSIEHMFSDQGDGDKMAVESIARVLKPGGMAIITVPMSNGGPFHESRTGDDRFSGPYRLYTPETIEERYLSVAGLETVRLSYLAHSSPDPYYQHSHFAYFWMDTITPQERKKWAWANPLLSNIFNPIVSKEEGEARLENVNTALICLRKK